MPTNVTPEYRKAEQAFKHKDFAKTLKFARLWGSSQFEGQHVGPDHQVADRDVVELHVQ